MIDGDLNNGARTKRRQSRRTGYRRRLRMQRLLLACIVGSVFAGACWLGAHLSFPARSSRSAAGLPESTWFRGNAHQNLASMAPQSAKPGKVLVASSDVYPYSVVPGGLKRAEDLRKAASQDAVVRSHYSHFDFDHARLVRVKEAREVYVSYRIRNTVYWTKKKIRLHVGELLLTDGTTTARAHCGNQISDTAKPEFPRKNPTRMFSTTSSRRWNRPTLRSTRDCFGRLAGRPTRGPAAFRRRIHFSLCALWCAASRRTLPGQRHRP